MTLIPNLYAVGDQVDITYNPLLDDFGTIGDRVTRRHAVVAVTEDRLTVETPGGRVHNYDTKEPYDTVDFCRVTS